VCVGKLITLLRHGAPYAKKLSGFFMDVHLYASCSSSFSPSNRLTDAPFRLLFFFYFFFHFCPAIA
jgi:hypothetical protein